MDDSPLSNSHPEQRADTAAWLAVVAGNLGALMATLDVSIINSSLPTIAGNIGASGTEATWVSTAYLVAEIIVIPLAGWLERVLQLRTFLLLAACLFTIFSVVCGLSTNLTTMIIGRVGQGFTGGAMIPTAQTIIATRLPRHQQPLGISFFGATAVLGPVIGPALGGWLTENLSWHWAFFLNVPICLLLIGLLLIGLPYKKPDLGRLAQADWMGIAGLTLALGGITIVLEEGQREDWFSSNIIVSLTLLSSVGFGLLLASQRRASHPVIRLSLLLNRQFGSIVVMVLVVGMVIYGTSYVIPQFLTAISNYNSYQAGLIVLLSGIPALILITVTPVLVRLFDIRIAVLTGMGLLAISAFLETGLTPGSAGGDFVDSQLLRGAGTILVLLFLNQAAIQSVPREYASDAAGLYNAARNLGGSLALAGISVVQDRRLFFHYERLSEHIRSSSPIVNSFLADQAQKFGGPEPALRYLSNVVQRQALVLTYVDLFWILVIGIVIVSPLTVFLRPLDLSRKSASMH
ncbi:DHA2 family efflux MFS transporter permease subunit [Brucella intermedia]|uniref:DHA2 family efflux MFS transporter permease subunit n=1 Tax=Brucella intermedia TaxID=94625 RepID=UPI00124C5DC6|nr:DHA2 family efflux MFS transporter permease subunit [Brucella intermedia]KAB2704041.1 DHA2 family efflux MFS transporter permease subunit [Brucella intermedia]